MRFDETTPFLTMWSLWTPMFEYPGQIAECGSTS